MKNKGKGCAIETTNWTTEITQKLKQRYPGWIYKVNEEEHLIYLYNDVSPQKRFLSYR